MKKNFLTGLERENLQGLNEEYNCIQCKEPITNPLCHNCLSEQMSKWLAFYPNVKKKIMPKIKTYVKQLNNTAVSSITVNATPIITVNFDMKHEGYIREAVEEGLY